MRRSASFLGPIALASTTGPPVVGSSECSRGEELRALTMQHGVVLIFDEVIT